MEDRELVAQDQDLDLFGGVGAGEQNHPRQDSGEGHVDHAGPHPATKQQVNG
ncbi:MAG TPA: hypothetical protein VNP92_06455 [Actinophytocola sp.]|nr:hypothetical protein [Actinophytocola sp.]